MARWTDQEHREFEDWFALQPLIHLEDVRVFVSMVATDNAGDCHNKIEVAKETVRSFIDDESFANEVFAAYRR